MVDFKNFFEEIKDLEDKKQYIKKIKGHKLPVIVFGAGMFADYLSRDLEKHGVEISGYAVDEKYFKPGQAFRGRPVFNFDELVTEPEKYVFILGMGQKLGEGKDLSLKRIDAFFHDKRIIKYFVAFPTEEIPKEYVLENFSGFEETYNLLEDELSKKTMIAYLKTHITGNSENVRDVLTPDEYFNDLTFGKFSTEAGYIDCGAYTGDTIEDYIKFTGGRYSKIFAFEPEKKNFEYLKKMIQEKHYENVILFNCGAWDKKDKLYFQSCDSGSNISDEGTDVIEVDSIDNTVGDNPIGLIKMDVEGAELKALQGAVKIIEKYKPVIAMSAYHRKEDLIAIPQFLKKFYTDAAFYLRKEEGMALYGLNLYVIPKK